MDFLNHDNNQADVIEAFNTISRYLNDLLSIGNPYFEGIVDQINALEQSQYHRYGRPLLDLHLPIANGFVSFKIYDKRD